MYKVSTATNEYFSPGAKIASELNIYNAQNGFDVMPSFSSVIDETSEEVIFRVFVSEVKVDTDGIVRTHTREMYSATVSKTSGTIIENGMDALANLFSKGGDGVPHTVRENMLIFAVNTVYYNNPYLYKFIKEKRILDRSYYRSCGEYKYFVLCVRENAFFERLLKTQFEVFNTQLPGMSITDFIHRFKDNAIPQSLMNEVSNMPANMPVPKRSILALLQRITEKEDGNSARLFYDWLKSYIELIESNRSSISTYTMEQFLNRIWNLIDKYGYNSKKLTDYLTRQSFFYGNFSVPHEEANTLWDYHENIAAMGTRGEQYPTYLLRSHNCAVRNNKAMMRITNEEMARFETVANALAVHYEVKTGDYIVRIPHTPKELISEGTALNHCVGGYVRPVMNEETIIGFIRSKADPEKSLYTIEMSGDHIIQAKGNFNEDLPADMNDIIKKIEAAWARKTKRAETDDEENEEREETI